MPRCKCFVCTLGCIDDVLGGCGFINGKQVPVDDDNSHGTHVAGTIGATKNGAGVMGVAQKVSLMSCKFLDANGDGFNSDAIACINYCAANFKRMGQKVPIYSNSWGCLNCYDPTVYNAIANTAGQPLFQSTSFTLCPVSPTLRSLFAMLAMLIQPCISCHSVKADLLSFCAHKRDSNLSMCCSLRNSLPY